MRREWLRKAIAPAAGQIPLLLLLGAGSLLSIAAARTVATLSRGGSRLEFELRADQQARVLERTIADHFRVVDMAALLLGRGEPNLPSSVRQRIETIRKDNPCLVAIAWFPAGSEPGHAPPALVVPASGFLPSVGGRDARIRISNALIRAKASGRCVAAGPFPGPDDVGPVYMVLRTTSAPPDPDDASTRFTGVVAGVVSLERTLEGDPLLTGLTLVDTSEARGVPVLVSSGGPARGAGPPSAVHDLEVAGLHLKAKWRPTPDVDEMQGRVDANLVLAGCLLLTALSGFLLELSRRTRRIAALSQNQAERLTAEIRDREQTEARYRALFEDAVLGIFRSTPGGRILDANPALVRMLGYERLEDVLALDLARDVYADPAERERILAESETGTPHLSRALTWKRSDGRGFRVRLTSRMIRNDDGDLVSIETIVEDVSRKATLEEQVRLAQRVEAIGRLAGGVAHDFNNLLTVVNGHSRELLEETDLAPLARHRLEKIEECGERAAELTRQLLAYGRRQVLRPQIVDLNLVIRNTEKLLGRLLREDVELVLDLEPALGKVRVDPAQMNQVLMNLALNARDAMPKGGRLEVETRNMTVKEGECPHGLLRPGSYAKLQIRDTGEGMDEETRAHVFEPFYTTRSVGGSTGLGLATVYGIVKQSGGFIFVTSSPGNGAAFSLYFPTQESPAPPKSDHPTAGRSEGGTETILVVEDEEAVLELVSTALEGTGYEVLPARNGAEAFRIFSSRPSAIDAVVTDMVMPEMGGAELVRRMRKVVPDVAVLLMSGYSQDAVASHGEPAVGTRFLEKPFDLDTLTRTLRELLDDEVTVDTR